MVTPNITFKHTDTEVDYNLQQILSSKLEALYKYLEEPSLIEVEFRKEAPKNKGNVYVVEINCTVKGTLHRAVAVEGSFEKAIDKSRNELDKELRRSHKKRNSLFKKGARHIKSMIRWGE
jgi:ribosomal subunit interface protein